MTAAKETSPRLDRLMEATRRVGTTARQNIEWLVDFCQRGFTQAVGDDAAAAALNDAKQDLTVFIGYSLRRSMSIGELDNREVLSLQRDLLELVGQITANQPATWKLGSVEKTLTPLGTQYYGPKNVLVRHAIYDLVERFRKEIALCASESCKRGPHETRRIFVRAGRRRFCSDACGSTARAARFYSTLSPAEKRTRRRASAR